MKKFLRALKSIEIPFFGNLLNYLELQELKSKEINIIIKIPKDILFLEDILKFEIKSLAEYYKVKIKEIKILPVDIESFN